MTIYLGNQIQQQFPKRGDFPPGLSSQPRAGIFLVGRGVALIGRTSLSAFSQEAMMPNEQDWREAVSILVRTERYQNQLDRDGCKPDGAIHEQITDRIDALQWALRILPKMETKRKFVDTVETGRDTNFWRHNRTKKRAYSTVGHTLAWVATEVCKEATA